MMVPNVPLSKMALLKLSAFQILITVRYSRRSMIQRMGNTSYLCEKRLLTDSCKGNELSYARCCSQALAVYNIYMCASARFRERWIVPIDVPCTSHLCVHVWVRHNHHLLVMPSANSCSLAVSQKVILKLCINFT